VKRIVNPIANCVYPRAKTLYKEAEIWDGELDESVLVYGMSRKMSWVASWAYARACGLDTLNLVLSNMYGPEDHFDEERSHALGALVMKFVKAKAEHAPHVVVWGTGDPVREWLYVDEGAEALVRALDAPATTDFVNIGVAEGISVRDLADRIRAAVGYAGEIVYDRSKPDGAPHKTMDGAHGEELLGWRPTIGLDEGIARTVTWYCAALGMA
jgi:GDP-L-fucose synthase